MKFTIKRTSLWSDEEPCEEATLEHGVYVDVRTSDDPAKVPYYKGESAWWYSEGTNHRIEDGHIKRDLPRDYYVIKIESLDDLVRLSDKYGSLIVGKSINYTIPTIEIYDDYRE